MTIHSDVLTDVLGTLANQPSKRLDITKPLQAVHNIREAHQRPFPVEYMTSFNGGHFVKHSASRHGVSVWFVDAEGKTGRTWHIENVENVPVTKSMVAVLYRWGEDIGLINFIDTDAARRFFTGNPGKILGMKRIEVSEGNHINEAF